MPAQPDSTAPLYEGLFLLDQQAVATDFAGAIDDLKALLERSEVDLITLVKWDERKLAYDIKGQRRGTFLLALFRCDGSQISRIERACNLSDTVLRCLIIRGDAYGETEIELIKQDADALVAEAKLRAEQAEAGEQQDDTPAQAPAAEEAPIETEIADSESADSGDDQEAVASGETKE